MNQSQSYTKIQNDERKKEMHQRKENVRVHEFFQ